jgi:hypothetical protein
MDAKRPITPALGENAVALPDIPSRSESRLISSGIEITAGNTVAPSSTLVLANVSYGNTNLRNAYRRRCKSERPHLLSDQVQREHNGEQAIHYRDGRHRRRTRQLTEEYQYENDELLDGCCCQDGAAGIGK